MNVETKRYINTINNENKVKAEQFVRQAEQDFGVPEDELKFIYKAYNDKFGFKFKDSKVVDGIDYNKTYEWYKGPGKPLKVSGKELEKQLQRGYGVYEGNMQRMYPKGTKKPISYEQYVNEMLSSKGDVREAQDACEDSDTLGGYVKSTFKDAGFNKYSVTMTEGDVGAEGPKMGATYKITITAPDEEQAKRIAKQRYGDYPIAVVLKKSGKDANYGLKKGDKIRGTVNGKDIDLQVINPTYSDDAIEAKSIDKNNWNGQYLIIEKKDIVNIPKWKDSKTCDVDLSQAEEVLKSNKIPYRAKGKSTLIVRKADLAKASELVRSKGIETGPFGISIAAVDSKLILTNALKALDSIEEKLATKPQGETDANNIIADKRMFIKLYEDINNEKNKSNGRMLLTKMQKTLSNIEKNAESDFDQEDVDKFKRLLEIAQRKVDRMSM